MTCSLFRRRFFWSSRHTEFSMSSCLGKLPGTVCKPCSSRLWMHGPHLSLRAPHRCAKRSQPVSPVFNIAATRESSLAEGLSQLSNMDRRYCWVPTPLLDHPCRRHELRHVLSHHSILSTSWSTCQNRLKCVRCQDCDRHAVWEGFETFTFILLDSSFPLSQLVQKVHCFSRTPTRLHDSHELCVVQLRQAGTPSPFVSKPRSRYVSHRFGVESAFFFPVCVHQDIVRLFRTKFHLKSELCNRFLSRPSECALHHQFQIRHGCHRLEDAGPFAPLRVATRDSRTLVHRARIHLPCGCHRRLNTCSLGFC